MKRIISSSLVCLFLCLMGSAIWTEAGASESMMESEGSSPENEYTYLAFIWDGYIYDLPPGMPIGTMDTKRLIAVQIPGNFFLVALLLPDECGRLEDYAFKGIMFTVDTPITVERNGLYVTRDDVPAIVVPKRVDIVGDVFYGFLTEVGTDYIDVELRTEFFAGNPADEIRRFAITDNTVICIADEPQLTPGDSYIIIGTPDGDALAIHLSRG